MCNRTQKASRPQEQTKDKAPGVGGETKWLQVTEKEAGTGAMSVEQINSREQDRIPVHASPRIHTSCERTTIRAAHFQCHSATSAAADLTIHHHTLAWTRAWSNNLSPNKKNVSYDHHTLLSQTHPTNMITSEFLSLRISAPAGSKPPCPAKQQV